MYFLKVLEMKDDFRILQMCWRIPAFLFFWKWQSVSLGNQQNTKRERMFLLYDTSKNTISFNSDFFKIYFLDNFNLTL